MPLQAASDQFKFSLVTSVLWAGFAVMRCIIILCLLLLESLIKILLLTGSLDSVLEVDPFNGLST